MIPQCFSVSFSLFYSLVSLCLSLCPSLFFSFVCNVSVIATSETTENFGEWMEREPRSMSVRRLPAAHRRRRLPRVRHTTVPRYLFLPRVFPLFRSYFHRMPSRRPTHSQAANFRSGWRLNVIWKKFVKMFLLRKIIKCCIKYFATRMKDLKINLMFAELIFP